MWDLGEGFEFCGRDVGILRGMSRLMLCSSVGAVSSRNGEAYDNGEDSGRLMGMIEISSSSSSSCSIISSSKGPEYNTPDDSGLLTGMPIGISNTSSSCPPISSSGGAEKGASGG